MGSSTTSSRPVVDCWRPSWRPPAARAVTPIGTPGVRWPFRRAMQPYCGAIRETAEKALFGAEASPVDYQMRTVPHPSGILRHFDNKAPIAQTSPAHVRPVAACTRTRLVFSGPVDGEHVLVKGHHRSDQPSQWQQKANGQPPPLDTQRRKPADGHQPEVR